MHLPIPNDSNHHHAMEAQRSQDGQPKPRSFRDAGKGVFQPTSPPRVTTEPPQRESKKSHLHGLHHHHHRHHHSHHRSRDKKELGLRDVVQSAVQLHPPTSFGDLLKSSSRSKEASPSHSRRQSTAVPKGEDEKDKREEPPPKPVKPEDVERERVRSKVRKRYV